MSRLFLIRHAEPAAAWGGADADPGLSGLGRSQAEAAARTLAGLGQLDVISSPMRRCRETAAPFAMLCGVSTTIEARVSEVVAPEGVSDRPAWLRANFPWDDGVARRRWSELDAALCSWRDETVAAVAALQRDVAVFTHFIAINAILSAVMGVDQTIVFRPAHASITELETTSMGLRIVESGAEVALADVR